jgi:hypothetical protein
VENKSDPKTRAKIRVNSVEINFIVVTGATVDVIDSKTYDRLKSSVKLCKRTTKIFACGSDKPLPLKGEFQATVKSNKRYTVSVIHVVEGGSGNLLSAKTAQDFGECKRRYGIAEWHAEWPAEWPAEWHAEWPAEWIAERKMM